MIREYFYGEKYQITPHFNSEEFRCKCGVQHSFYVSDELTSKLEQLRSELKCSKIIITSGYRCPEHDKNVGGSGTGQHTKGNAVDICCYDQSGNIISSKLVCCKAQDLDFKGIANITNSYDCTHVDVRSSSKWYGDEVYGTGTVTDDFYSYFNLKKGQSTFKLSGIDVSYAQGKIDWDKVNIDFALLRAGYGKTVNQKDSTFDRNYAECKRRGIPVGAYWFSYAMTPEEAVEEAKAFLAVIKGKQFEYPLYYDVEVGEQFKLGREAVSNIIKAFLNVLEKENYYVGLYCSTSYLEGYVTKDILDKYTIWVAQYNSKCTFKGNYDIWQHSVAGDSQYDIFDIKSISGVTGKCDCDYCYKDFPSIIKNANMNGFKSNTKPEYTEANIKVRHYSDGKTVIPEQEIKFD